MRGVWLTLLVALALLSPLQARELPPEVAWLWEFKEWVSAPPAVQRGVALVATGKTVRGLRLDDGEEVWSLELPTEVVTDHPLPVVDGAAILPPTGGRILAIDIASGQERWRSRASTMAPRLCMGRVIAADGPWLEALDAKSGEIRWRPLDEALPHLAQLEVRGSLILGANGKELGLWDLRQAKLLWQVRAEGAKDLQLGRSGAYYRQDNAIVCRDTATGRQLWRLPKLDGYALLDDILMAWSGESVLAFNVSSGRRLWRRKLDNYYAMAADAGPNMIAVGSGWVGQLLDRRTGKTVQAMGPSYFPPLLDGSSLLIAGRFSELFRLDAKTGRRLAGISGIWGVFHAWGTICYRVPPGLVAGDWRLIPAGYSLTAIGPGPGTLRPKGVPKLTLRFEGISDTPHAVRARVGGTFLRGFTIAAYRWIDGNPADPSRQKPDLLQRVNFLTGTRYTEHWMKLKLKEPGNYTVQVTSGDLSERGSVRVP